MTKQVSKEYQTSDQSMAAYLAEVRKLEKKFVGLEVRYIPRKDNCRADSLARLASSRSPCPPGTFVERISTPSIVSNEPRDEGMVNLGSTGHSRTSPGTDAPRGVAGRLVAPLDPEDSWIEPIRMYLHDRTVPEDDTLSEQLARRARMYSLVDGALYRRGAH